MTLCLSVPARVGRGPPGVQDLDHGQWSRTWSGVHIKTKIEMVSVERPIGNHIIKRLFLSPSSAQPSPFFKLTCPILGMSKCLKGALEVVSGGQVTKECGMIKLYSSDQLPECIKGGHYRFSFARPNIYPGIYRCMDDRLLYLCQILYHLCLVVTSSFLDTLIENRKYPIWNWAVAMELLNFLARISGWRLSNRVAYKTKNV